MQLISSSYEIMSVSITKEMQTLLTFYFMWIVLHHLSGHVYIYFCTPNSIIGFITSPLMVATPHCTAIRWMIYEGGNIITTMWVSVGTYVATKILTY